MQHPVDAHRRDRRALERREQHAAQRVAQRDAEAALERLDDELAVAVVSRRVVGDDLLRHLEVLPLHRVTPPVGRSATSDRYFE